jgi:hypothetical protein
MKPLTVTAKTILLLVLSCLALKAVFAQGNVNAAVFVTGDNNVIQIGNFIETTPGDVPVSIYYNQHTRTFYYTWYSASKGYHILKAYNTYSYSYNEYWGTYYEKGYTPAQSTSSY